MYIFIYLYKNIKMYNNFFKNNDYLDGKTISLIANNPLIENISEINKYNIDDNSVVIRFNEDPKGLLKKIFVKRCDIMFYRSNHIGKFSNFRKGHLKNYKQIVFTKVSNKSNKIQNDDCNFKEMLNRLKLKNYNFAYLSRDNSKLSPTTGFGVLENIIENVNYSKLVLVGFTNLTRETVKKKKNMVSIVCITKINIFKIIS